MRDGRSMCDKRRRPNGASVRTRALVMPIPFYAKLANMSMRCNGENYKIYLLETTTREWYIYIYVLLSL
jgi:hypothetical protein